MDKGNSNYHNFFLNCIDFDKLLSSQAQNFVTNPGWLSSWWNMSSMHEAEPKSIVCWLPYYQNITKFLDISKHKKLPWQATTTMKECWSPWYYYDSVKSGSKACAATTIFFSTFSIIYICHCLSGGDSSQFFLPLFETDVDTSEYHTTISWQLCNVLGWFYHSLHPKFTILY